MARPARPEMDRFSEKYVIADNGCWVWTAFTDRDGYGNFLPAGGKAARNMRAHRFSYTKFVGDIPDGMLVCHTCDNPPCVNPAHLFIGTPADNSRDMREKGRQGTPKGSNNGQSVLTERDIPKIRRLHKAGLSYPKIAKLYGCGMVTIADIIVGKTWVHITS